VATRAKWISPKRKKGRVDHPKAKGLETLRPFFNLAERTRFLYRVWRMEIGHEREGELLVVGRNAV
jgi:hypothetical protein